MSERDTDFEFDFFEEPETREAPPPERPPRLGPRRPGGPPTGFTPLLRLAGLVAFVILLVVLLVFWVQSCEGASKQGAYRGYMDKVQVLATNSEQIGRQLDDALTSPGAKASDLASKLNGLAQQQQLDVGNAQGLRPPGPLRPEQQHLVEALQLRVSGLSGLAKTFSTAGSSKDLAAASGVLAEQAQRLVASDVVWDDLFKDPSVAELQRQNVGGVAVPESHVLGNGDYASARTWLPVLQRIQGASTGGTPSGIHGTGIVGVKALPKGTVLSTSQETTVVATTDLAFAVTIEDTGGSQEVQIPVTLTIQEAPKPIVRKQTIDVIDPGQQKTLVFGNLGQVQFATKVTVRVDVQPVPGERNLANNTDEYPVIFSLG